MKRRYAEFILLLGGACLLVKGGWNLASYAAFQSHPDWYTASVQARPNTELLPITLHVPNNLQNLNGLQVLGKLEVPRLGMSVLVVEGDDDKKLGLAAGHIEGTAVLGGNGNAVVAGHRDTSFWPLRKIKIGDRIRVRAGKTYNYVVSSIRVVNPDDTGVLDGSSGQRTLTLVTCYPFRYFGSAPKRFIVQATVPGT